MDSINGMSYYLNKMLDAMKRITFTDDNFFFQKDSTLVRYACSTVQLLQRSQLQHFE